MNLERKIFDTYLYHNAWAPYYLPCLSFRISGKAAVNWRTNQKMIRLKKGKEKFNFSAAVCSAISFGLWTHRPTHANVNEKKKKVTKILNYTYPEWHRFFLTEMILLQVYILQIYTMNKTIKDWGDYGEFAVCHRPSNSGLVTFYCFYI